MGESTYRNVEGNRPRIVILGSGNVATHLALALDKFTDVIQVWSRTPSNSQALVSQLLRASVADNLENIRRDADFYIIAVSDDAVTDIGRHLRDVSGVVVHTSGSVGMGDLKMAVNSDRCGVFYPLQTFSKGRQVDITKVPILIEGCNENTEKRLRELASVISEKVFIVDSGLRSRLHLAAVFANNFTNYIWLLADKYLKENTDYNLEILSPLLQETLAKALEMSPEAAQTGPARRGDTVIVAKHLSNLDPESAKVYKLLSESILNKFHKN